jgi:hypothetical protein
LASWYPEEAFLRIQLNFVSVEIVESFSQIIDESSRVSGFDGHVVDVNLNISANPMER